MPYTTSVAGTTITAAWSNSNNRDQVITPFASTTARDAAITAPVEGMFCVTTDENIVWCYTGSAWVQFERYGAWTDITANCTFSAWFDGDVTKNVFASRIGNTCSVRVTAALSAAPGTASCTIELPASSPWAFAMKSQSFSSYEVGPAEYVEGGVANNIGLCRINDDSGSARTIEFVVHGSATGVTQANPFTWGSGDRLNCTIRYELAA